MKIHVLRSTPYHRVGETLSPIEFAKCYYLPGDSQPPASDDPDVCRERTIAVLRVMHQGFFMVEDEDELPLEFLYNGMIYAKQLDGMYHTFLPNQPRIPSESHGCIMPVQARELIAGSRFKGHILLCTNDRNVKV